MRRFIVLAFLTALAPNPVPAAPPGGGNGVCCFHPGTNRRWVVGETAPNGTLLTAANIGAMCVTGQLPERRACAAGQ